MVSNNKLNAILDEALNTDVGKELAVTVFRALTGALPENKKDSVDTNNNDITGTRG